MQEKESELDEQTRFELSSIDKIVEHLSIELRELQLENEELRQELAKYKKN